MNTKGIIENGLKEMSIDMLAYEEEFKKIFNEVVNTINKTDEFLTGEIKEAYQNSQNDFSKNYNFVLKNIHSYSEAFMQLIHTYMKNDLLQKEVK